MCTKHPSLKSWTLLRRSCTAFALLFVIALCLKDMSHQSQRTELGIRVVLSLLSLLIRCRCPTPLVGHHSQQKKLCCVELSFHILLLHEMKLTQHAVTYSAGWNSAFPVRFLLAPPLKCNISSKNILGSPEPVCCTQTWLCKTSLELQGKHLKTHSNKHCVYGVLNMF